MTSDGLTSSLLLTKKKRIPGLRFSKTAAIMQKVSTSFTGMQATSKKNVVLQLAVDYFFMMGDPGGC